MVQLDGDVVTILLSPFVALAAISNQRNVVGRIDEMVFQPLATKQVSLPINYASFSQLLFDAGSDKYVLSSFVHFLFVCCGITEWFRKALQRNRALLYGLRQKLTE